MDALEYWGNKRDWNISGQIPVALRLDTSETSNPLIFGGQMAFVDLQNKSEVVRYHKPTDEQVKKHENLAQAAEYLIEAILINCPPCADTSAAIRKVREAKMTASAAVALDGLI